MAQTRVTEYFSQSKRGGVDRTLRSKSRKPSSEDRVVPEPNLPTAGPRPRSSSTAHTAPRAVQEDREQLRSVQEEFLRVIDEAVSAPDHAEGSAESRSSGKPGPPDSPRTPKRTSTQAEFDLCSAVFSSATEQHSTAKKRLRVTATKEPNTARSVEAGERRTARKKLVLFKHGETEVKLARITHLYLHAQRARANAHANANFPSIVGSDFTFIVLWVNLRCLQHWLISLSLQFFDISSFKLIVCKYLFLWLVSDRVYCFKLFFDVLG